MSQKWTGKIKKYETQKDPEHINLSTDCWCKKMEICAQSFGDD